MMALPPKKRAILLKRVAGNIAKISKSNITRQQTPDGTPWPKRKMSYRDKKVRKKMLIGLKGLIKISNFSDENHADIYVGKGKYGVHAGIIGTVNSEGKKIRHKADKKHYEKARARRKAKGITGCSRGQAKKLRKLGYKIRARRMNPNAPKGKMKVPTISFMVKNFSDEETQGAFGQLYNAGLIPQGKSDWTVTLPQRRFLGADKKNTAKAWARAFQSIKYGKRK